MKKFLHTWAPPSIMLLMFSAMLGGAAEAADKGMGAAAFLSAVVACIGSPLILLGYEKLTRKD